MLKQSEDRRTRRTRKLLKQGLLELMRERRFADISIRDITERMDMNRGTFYLHYRDTASLLQSIETDMLDEAQALIDAHLAETAGGTLRPVFEPILDFVLANRDTCRALFDNNASSGFVSRLQELIYRNGVNIVRARFHPESEDQLAYLLSFIAYGLIGLVKEWFDQDMALPKETLVLSADRLVNGAAESLLT